MTSSSLASLLLLRALGCGLALGLGGLAVLLVLPLGCLPCLLVLTDRVKYNDLAVLVRLTVVVGRKPKRHDEGSEGCCGVNATGLVALG